MKSVKKITLIGILVLMISMGLTACGSTPDYYGKWETFNQEEYGYLEFTKENVYFPDGAAYSYTRDGDKIVIDFPIRKETFEYSIDGEFLTLIDKSDNSESKYLAENVFRHDEAIFKEVVGLWRSNNNRIIEITDNQKIKFNNNEELFDFEINDKYIRTEYDNIAEYMPYSKSADRLELEVYDKTYEYKKIDEEVIDESNKINEGETRGEVEKKEENKKAENIEQQDKISIEIDDYYRAENYLLFQLSMTNLTDDTILLSNGAANLLTDQGVSFAKNTSENAYSKIESDKTTKISVGFELVSDKDWENSENLDSIVFYNEEEPKRIIGKVLIESYNPSSEEIQEYSELPEYLYRSENGLLLVTCEPFEENSSKYIVGLIENPTTRVLKDVTISFDLYDQDGNVIGETFDYISEIKPEGKWKYKARVYNEEVHQFDLQNLTSY